MSDYTINIQAKATGLTEIESRINKLKSQKVQIGIDASTANVSSALSSLIQQLNTIKTTASSIQIPGITGGATGSGGTSAVTGATKYYQSVSKIAEKYNNRTYENQLSKAKSMYSQLGGLSAEHQQAAEKAVRKMEGSYSRIANKYTSDDFRKKAASVFDESRKTLDNIYQMARRDGNYFIDEKKLASAQARIEKIIAQNPRLSKVTTEAGENLGTVAQSIQQNLNHSQVYAGNYEKEMTRIAQLNKDMIKYGAGGKGWLGETSEAFKRIGTFALTYGGIQKGIQAISNSVNELKQVDTILTEISKTSRLEGRQLQEIGAESFGKASKYGRTATDYLYGVQEMSRAGFYGSQATQMSELSLMAQAAGDLTADQANDYILASNAAFKYGGNVEKLNALLDGQNMIADRNAVSMEDMQAATQKAASVAETFGVKEEELSALIGTATARTRLSGDVTGRAIRSLLINLENINNNKIVKTLQAAGVAQTEFVDGVEKSRSAIDILQDLQVAYSSLGEGSPLRNEILTNIGGKNFANTLAAMLEGWDDYEKMLEDFSEGTGSAQREADKSANNWEGTLNKLKNSFTSLVSNFANSTAITNSLKGLNLFVQGLDKAVSAIGGVATTLTGLSIYAGRKSIASIFSIFKDKGMIDGFQALGSGLRSWFSSGISGITVGIGAFSAVIKALDYFDQKRQKSNQAIIDNAKSTFDAQSEVLDAYSAYSELVTSGSTDTAAMNEATASLSEALSNVGTSFDVAAAHANGYTNAIKDTVAATTQDAALEAQRAQQAAYENLYPTVPGIIKQLLTDPVNGLNSIDRRLRVTGVESGGAASVISEYYSDLDRLDEYTANGELDTRYAKKLQESLAERQEPVEQAVKATLNAAMLQYESGVLNGVAPQTYKQFDAMKAKIYDAFKDEAGEVPEDVVKQIESTMKQSFPELAQLSNEAANRAKTSLKTIRDHFTENLKDEHGDSNQAIEDWFDGLTGDAQKKARSIQMESFGTIFDPKSWGTSEWQNQLDYMQKYGESQAESLSKFRQLLAGGTEEEPDEWYSDIQNSVSQIQDLQSVLDDLDTGGFKNLDKMALIEKFPELAGYTGDLETLQSRIKDLQSVTKENMMQDFAIQLEAMGVEGNVAREALESLANEIDRMTDLDFTFDIEAETSKFEALGTAMQESVSGTGLTNSSINQLEAMFGGLDGYNADALFEKTANGIRVNTQELNKMRSAYEATKSVELAQDIMQANEAYERQAAILGQMQQNGGYSSQQLAAQQGLVDQLKGQADAAAQAAAQFDGLTSAYNKYLQALNGGDQRDQLEAMSGGYETAKTLMDQGWAGSDDFKTYVDYWKELDPGATVDDYVEAFGELDEQIENTSYSLHDMMTFDDNGNFTADGVHKFFDALGQIEEATGQSFSKISEDGQKIWDFTDGGETKVAELMGTTTEAVEGFIAAASDAGYDIKFDVNTSNLDQARTILSGLSDSQLTDIKVQLGLSEEAGIDQILGALQETNAVITVNADGSLAVSQIQSDVDGVETTVVAEGDGTKAKAEIQADVAGIQSTVDATGTATITYNQGAQPTATDQTATVNYTLGSQDNPEDKTAKANYELGTSPTTVPAASGTANFSLGSYPTSLPPIHQTIYQHVIKLGGSTTWTGTAHAMGTAKASGDWRVGSNQNALVGELGTELVVRNGQFFTVGDEGATFFPLQANDIVFNHRQTEQLLKYGHINSRGQALVTGSAFSDSSTAKASSYAASQAAKATGKTTTTTTTTTKTSGSGSGSKGGSSSNKTTTKSTDTKKDTKATAEYFDWIEVKLDRIERKLKKIKTKADSAFENFGVRISATEDEIGQTNVEISAQGKAAKKYSKAAKKVGLKKKWRKKVDSGAFNINAIKDEKLKEKIRRYQELREKALDASQAQLELKESLKELYQQKFELVQSQYEHALNALESRSKAFDQQISKREAEGYIISSKAYQNLIDTENDRIKKLKQEQSALQTKFTEAVKKGKIAANSEAWYTMKEAIQEVTDSIAEANTQLAEYAQKQRELGYESFERITDGIKDIADEASFLKGLMEDEDMFDENGQRTKYGEASLGLTLVAYDTYMAETKKYADEINKLNASLAKSPYNQELIDKKQEYIEAQRTAIENANQERQAMKKLVEDGIKAQIDSLKDAIKEYEKLLDSQKDAYDYQKNIEKQVEQINALRKQLAAWSNDTSEEGAARRQKTQKELKEAEESLADTQEQRRISQIKEMLSELSDDYDELMNQRLDQIDMTIDEVRKEVSNSRTEINNTLKEVAGELGGTVSTAITTSMGTGVTNAVKAIVDEEAKKQAAATAAATQQQATAAQKTAQKTAEAQRNDQIVKAQKAADTAYAAMQQALQKYNQAQDEAAYAKKKFGKKSTQYTTALATAKKKKTTYETKKTAYNKALANLKSVRGYAEGSSDILGDEFAWTQDDNGQELIARKSDGAILTRLGTGDKVFTNTMTDNLWNLARNPADAIGIPALRLASMSGGFGGDNDVDITFNLPNVANVPDFIRELQSNRQFEQIVQKITLGRANGRGTLHKYTTKP